MTPRWRRVMSTSSWFVAKNRSLAPKTSAYSIRSVTSHSGFVACSSETSTRGSASSTRPSTAPSIAGRRLLRRVRMLMSVGFLPRGGFIRGECKNQIHSHHLQELQGQGGGRMQHERAPHVLKSFVAVEQPRHPARIE